MLTPWEEPSPTAGRADRATKGWVQMTEHNYEVTDGVTGTLEEGLRREIEYYEHKAAHYGSSDTLLARSMTTVYRYSAAKKKQVLAAIEECDGDRAPKHPY